MAQAQINLMFSKEEVPTENYPVPQAGGGKKTIIIEKRIDKRTRSYKPIKKDPNHLANKVATTSQSKRPNSAGTKADAVWSNLANDDKNPSIEQSEHARTDQDITIFVAPEPEPTIKILEQPEPGYRFRYGSEAGVVSLLHGANSSKTVKTSTKLQLVNFEKKNYKKVDIFVSCVTHNDPHPIVHPYLIKNSKRKKGTNCSNGVCHVTMHGEDDTVEFADIGIQRVKSDQTEKSLADRKEMRIDPFNQGYEYKHSHFDKEALKLCFQAQLTDLHGNVVVLPPVTSNTISFTKSKAMSLHSVTPNEASSEDSVKLSLFAENLPRAGDIYVMFYTPEWSYLVLPEYQHHNCGLHVLTPRLDVEITEKTTVKIRLVRISNQAATEHLDFFFFPPKKIQQLTQTLTSRDLLQDQTFRNGANETIPDLADQNVKMLENSPATDVYLNYTHIDSHLAPSVSTPACNSSPLMERSSANNSPSNHPHRYELNVDNLENLWDPSNPDYTLPVIEDENQFPYATTQLFLPTGLDVMDYI